jgi:carboxypeptidase Taq
VGAKSERMSNLSPFQELKQKADQIWTLKEVSSLLGWDQQTLMPDGSADGRANHLAVLDKTCHELLTRDSFAQALSQAENSSPDEQQQCYLRYVRRAYNRAAKMPSQLVDELSRATSAAHIAWVSAKTNDDFKSFCPHLERIYDLKKQEAEAVGFTEHPYDALLDEYEPDMKTKEVGDVFAALQPKLSALVAELTASPKQPSDRPMRQHFPIEGQKVVSHWMLEAIGFDFNCGRLDVSAHPFCSSSSSRDVRLTDRYDENFLAPAVFGALHEGGHGLYEQGSPVEFNGTPLRGGCSLGIHESQSRLWENFVGRGLPFWQANYRKLQSIFPEQLSGYDLPVFYGSINQVRPSLIRVEADEVTYTLHVILRFELEKALLTREVDVKDLPEIWRSKMTQYLGVTPPNDRQGVLQDIHWSAGYVGYFPTYSLGNLVAAMLWERILKDIPDTEEQLRKGNTAPVLAWLRSNIHQHASLYCPTALLDRLGMKLEAQPFMNYLNNKFRPLYGLSE